MAKPLVRAVVTLPLVLAALAGCSGTGTTTVSSGGACGGPASPGVAQYLAAAPAAFVGIMLLGPEADAESGKALTHPHESGLSGGSKAAARQ